MSCVTDIDVIVVTDDTYEYLVMASFERQAGEYDQDELAEGGLDSFYLDEQALD